jgi:hypothetical protein
MAVLFFSGFESGDLTDFQQKVGTGNVTGTVAVDQTIVNTWGVYSCKMPWPSTGGNNQVFASLPTALSTTATTRFYFYTTAAGTATVAGILIYATNSGGTPSVGAQCVTDGSGGLVLKLWNYQGVPTGGSQVGSSFAINSATWYRIDVATTFSATVGTAEMRVNGAVVATGSGLNTLPNGSFIGGVSLQTFNISGTGGTGNCWFDDVIIRNDLVYSPDGYCIARQFTTTVPNYDSWTKTTGTISTVWDKTPYNTASNANSATSTAQQTGVVDFTTTGGTGTTGFGNGVVGASDTINALKFGAVGLSGVNNDAQDSAVFRTPAGGGGADTTVLVQNGILGGGAGWSSSTCYVYGLFTSAPTTAQIINMELGIKHNATTNTHTVYAAWAMIDWLPAPPVVTSITIGTNYVEDWSVDY